MAADTTLALVFAGLLAVSAVILVFFPLLRHAWVFAATRIGFLLLVGPIIVLSLAAIALVALAAANPLYLLPVVAVTVGLRVASPILLYRRVRDSLEQRRSWVLLRYLLIAGFVGLAGILMYNVLTASPSGGPGVLSEQVLMALGASFIIIRLALRGRPRDRTSLWPLWLAAILFGIALVVVAPYAFPEFAILYAISGSAGWALGAAVIWREPWGPPAIEEYEVEE